MKLCYYVGCTSQNVHPEIESSARLVLRELGVELIDMPGASCCPTPGIVPSYDELAWLALAARNIAIAEEKGHDIVVTCNGCYYTLYEANRTLKADKSLAVRVNEMLAKAGCTPYRGTVNVLHVVEVLDAIGPSEIERHVTRPLSDLRVVVHYGCHFLRPSSRRAHGYSPINPTVVEEILKPTGIEVLNWRMKEFCHNCIHQLEYITYFL